MNKVFIFLCAILCFISLSYKAPAAEDDEIKKPILGSAVSPAHYPNSTPEDFENFYNLAAQMGDHVTLITEWEKNMQVEIIQKVMTAAKSKGLKFHLYLSPIALYGGRKTPSIPPNILGNKTFRNIFVRAAFKEKALELASLRPDYLGLGTEVNFLAQNPEEFKHYVSLVEETYRKIKEEYPDQTVTISFQWDIMITQKQFNLLNLFKRSLDVYSFTTYPSFFKEVYTMPIGYYASVRKILPHERIGFSEVGWNSTMGSTEQEQALFYSKLPAFMEGVHPEFITLGLMHDVKVFSGELNTLNYVGVRNNNGTPKSSWDVVLNLDFKD